MIKDNDNAHRNSNDNVALRQDREDALPRGTAYHNSDDNIDSLHRVVGSWTWVSGPGTQNQGCDLGVVTDFSVRGFDENM